MKCLKPLWFVLFFIAFSKLSAQSPYQFNWKKESSVVLLGGATMGIGAYYRSTMPLLSTEYIGTLNKTDVNSFDRLAIGYYSKSADSASDVFWGSAHIMPLIFLAGKKSRNDFGAIACMYGEIFLVNTGLTILTKNTFRRSRPFVYNPDVPFDKKLTKTARSSFVSGHTSMTAANCFFAATLFSDYYPESNWKPVVWTSAAIIPAITGYLRIRAGKHYPTDTIAGYAMGAAVGMLVPQLHKKKMENISFHGGPGGMLVQVQY